MRHVFLVVLFLAIFASLLVSVNAAGSQYTIVVGADSPATDVITGANFAASMKASVAVTFVSAIDTDIYPTLTADGMNGRLFVVIDGKRVRMVGGLQGDVRDAAEAYFKGQGFTVEQVFTRYTPEDILLHPPQAGPGNATGTAPSETPSLDVPPPPQDTSDNETVAINAQVNNLNTGDANAGGNQNNENTTSPSLPPPQRQGFFASFWSWLKGLFS